MSTAPDVTVVIPVYNSEKTIVTLVDALREELKDYDFTIVLVDDGSRDASYQLCRQLAESDARIRFISFFMNFGQLSAILAGLRAAEGKIVVVMDDDLQNPPHEIHKLLAAIEAGDDFVFGVPSGVASHAFWRTVGSRFNAKMNEIVFRKPKDVRVSSYYALRQNVAREVTKYDGPYPYLSGLIFRTTRRGRNIEVEHHSRQAGKSGYTFTKLLKLAVNGMTNFSILPLRLSIFFGLALSSVGFLYLSYIVVSWLMNAHRILPGWTSIIALLLLFSGIQLIALGFLGEYLGRIFLFTNKAPQYTIRESFNCGAENKG